MSIIRGLIKKVLKYEGYTERGIILEIVNTAIANPITITQIMNIIKISGKLSQQGFSAEKILGRYDK